MVREPVRRIAFPFAGDAWALPGSQAEPEATVTRLRATGDGPVRLRAVAKTSTGPGADTVDGDVSSLDVCLVKISKDERGNVTLARTVTVVVATGSEAIVGQQLTEEDVSAGETFVVGIVTATQDAAAAAFVYVDAGARVVRT